MHHKSTAVIITVVLILIALAFLLLPGTAMPPAKDHSDGTDTHVDNPVHNTTTKP